MCKLTQRTIQLFSLWALLTIMTHSPAFIEPVEDQRKIFEQLKSLSLEELSEVEIFNPESGLATRKIQKLTETAAALFVITQEDIRRAGITHLAEALRMVPGMQVARWDTHQWAISARGFNEQWASKLLVMIDGRTVYSPMRSEVNWDTQDVLMEDVERIEVIRGPGASLWGANAVNGVINIITKPTQSTQGNLVSTYFGKGEERAIIGLRHGGEVGQDGHYRVYGKFYEHDTFVDTQGDEHDNGWAMKRGGFRVDWEHSSRDTISLQGNLYDGFAQQSIQKTNRQKTEMTGANLLARWERDLKNGDMILQSYYDLSQRKDSSYDEKRGIYDLDFQHRWAVNEQHEFLWGLGFRYSHDNIESYPPLNYTPQKRQDSLFSAFAQSEFKIPLEDDNEDNGHWQDLRLILGSRIEQNDYTGFEIQPTARLLWNKNDRHLFWGAISRAVRTPSRTDSDFSLNTEVPSMRVLIQGNPEIESEVLLAYELGYRFNLINHFLLDLSLFYNDYDKLRTSETIDFQPYPPPPLLIFKGDNQMDGEVYGLEIATHWQVNTLWKLIATYSYLDMQLHPQLSSTDTNAELSENNSPHHQASLRSLFDVSNTVEGDIALYYVDTVPGQNVSDYTRFDVRLGWQPQPRLDLSLGVRNLFDNQHHEFGTGERGISFNEVQRAFYMQLKYQF
jgi:iron complex outermembrane recepter protein